MKILITGSSGFIGKQLVKDALARGHHVVALYRSQYPNNWVGLDNLATIKCDLSQDEIPKLAPFAIDCVVHLAAEMQPDKNISIEQLLTGTQKLVNAAEEANIPKFIGISSIAVMDYLASKPLDCIDENLAVANQFDKMGRYAVFKAMQEDIVKAFTGNNANWLILRPGLVYQKGQISTAHAGIIKGKLQVLVDHAGEVPFVELGSVVNAILLAIDSDTVHQQIVQIVDDSLPTQFDYHQLLQHSGAIKSDAKHLSRQVLAFLIAYLLYPVSKLFGLKNLLPEMLLPQAFASRMKPFKFSNSKAKKILNWTANRFQ